MVRVRQHWAGKRWLSPRNRYRSDCVKAIKRDTQPGKQFVHTQLSEYVSASSMLHCFDGWSYFGRAVAAELAGDSDAARHLGYYAELRAAMSVLAGEGVGVFNRQHIIVIPRSRCDCLTGEGTHTFTWDALQEWAASPAGARTVFSVIRPGGVALREWLSQFAAGANFIATRWLLQWGLDIRRLTDDREARNLASYRPTAYTSPAALPLRDTLDTVGRLWELCEPGPVSPFPVLDRHLLRLSLELAFRNSHAHGRTRAQARAMFARQARMMLRGVTPGELNSDQWDRFLNYADLTTTPQVLVDAAGTLGPDDPHHSRQVLARALLLLRVATGANQELVEALPLFNRKELQFWWSRMGEERGLWSAANPPTMFSDLWTDVADATSELDAWMKGPPTDSSRRVMWRDKAPAAALLCSSERVALWGLAI